MIRSGDLFERTFETPKGPVDLLAEVVIEGDTLHLCDIVVFGRSGVNLSGLTRHALAARSELIVEVRAMGYRKLRLTGQRLPSSSSGNSGHPIDLTVDLKR